MSKLIKITFPDSSSKSYPFNSTCLDIVKSISNSLAKKPLVASINDVIVDLSYKISSDGSIKFFTWDDIEGKSWKFSYRH